MRGWRVALVAVLLCLITICMPKASAESDIVYSYNEAVSRWHWEEPNWGPAMLVDDKGEGKRYTVHAESRPILLPLVSAGTGASYPSIEGGSYRWRRGSWVSYAAVASYADIRRFTSSTRVEYAHHFRVWRVSGSNWTVIWGKSDPYNWVSARVDDSPPSSSRKTIASWERDEEYTVPSGLLDVGGNTGSLNDVTVYGIGAYMYNAILEHVYKPSSGGGGGGGGGSGSTRATLIVDAYVVESWRWWSRGQQQIPNRYGPQLIVPLRRAYFAGRSLPLYTLYFPHNATGIQPYAVEVALEEPYVVVDAGWEWGSQGFYTRYRVEGGVAYLVSSWYGRTASATSKPLTGTFTVFLKWEGFGLVRVLKGDGSSWVEVYNNRFATESGASFSLTLSNERVRVEVTYGHYIAGSIAASIALAQRVPGYTKGLRFVGWWLEYAYQQPPYPTLNPWYWVGVYNSTLVSGYAGSDRYGGSINRVRALYVFEPNLVLSARLLGVPEGKWVNDLVTITGVIDGGSASVAVPINGSRSASLAVASSYSFTAPATALVKVRGVEAQLVNQRVTPHLGFWWDRFFNGTYTIIVEKRPAPGHDYSPLRVYTCRVYRDRYWQSCSFIGELGTYTRRRVFEATFAGYIMLHYHYFSSLQSQIVNVTMVKQDPANAVFLYWEVDGRRVESSSVSGARPSGASTLVAVYALGEYRPLTPVELLTNQTMLPPGATIPNPIAYVPGTACGSGEHVGKKGVWLLTVTHVPTNRTSPYEAGLLDDRTWVWALISNGTESMWVPVTGVWRLNMTQDWDPSRYVRNLSSGVIIVEWNRSTIVGFPKIEEPQAYRGWHLIALSAWRVQFEELGQGYNTAGVWLDNGTTLALYNVTFTYMGVDGRRVEYVFWQPVAVSTFSLKAEARYTLEDHDPVLGRRRVLMSIHVNVTWKYVPPERWQRLGFRVHAPQLGFAVSLEEPGCTSTACIGYWTLPSYQAGSTWRLYVLELGDAEEFYASAHPRGLLGRDGYSSVRDFRLTIRWLGAGDHPTTLVWGSDRVSFQMAPATVYMLEWSDPKGPFTVTYGCFKQGPTGLEPLSSYRADLTFDWGAVGSTHPLNDSRFIPSERLACEVRKGTCTCFVDLLAPAENWIAFYLLPERGAFAIGNSTIVPVPLVAKYPPRG